MYAQRCTMRVLVDADSLARLARLAEGTGGRICAAQTGEQLQAVYADIGSSIGHRTEERELTAWAVAAALAAAAGSLIWFFRFPWESP